MTKLWIEGPGIRINHSPKQVLSSLHWTSSVYFYWNTQHPWGSWATCPLKALVVTFFQEGSFNGNWGEKYALPYIHSGGGNRCPCNTNTVQEISREFVHQVPTLHFKLDSPIPLGKMGLYNSACSQCTVHLHKETSIWPAFTVTKFHFFHNQF